MRTDKTQSVFDLRCFELLIMLGLPMLALTGDESEPHRVFNLAMIEQVLIATTGIVQVKFTGGPSFCLSEFQSAEFLSQIQRLTQSIEKQARPSNLVIPKLSH